MADRFGVIYKSFKLGRFPLMVGQICVWLYTALVFRWFNMFSLSHNWLGAPGSLTVAFVDFE